MRWRVEFDETFEVEFRRYGAEVQDALLATARLLADYGPQLGRPYVDTLKGSRFANMKELRFEAADGVRRSLSIRGEQRFSWSPVTSPVAVGSDFTSS